MLSSLRARSVRNLLVVVMIAVSALLAVQLAGSAVNSVQHELSIAHPGVDFEGDGHVVSDAHVAHDGAGHAGFDPGGDKAPGPHHHHPDAPQLVPVEPPAAQDVALSASTAVFAAAITESPLDLVSKLERPPRSRSAHQA